MSLLDRGGAAAVEATWTFGAALLPALSRIRSPLPSLLHQIQQTAVLFEHFVGAGEQ
jgi:hypothetical protein